jgi:hypothetical protein
MEKRCTSGTFCKKKKKKKKGCYGSIVVKYAEYQICHFHHCKYTGQCGLVYPHCHATLTAVRLQSANTLILDFQPSKLRENKFLLGKPTGTHKKRWLYCCLCFKIWNELGQLEMSLICLQKNQLGRTSKQWPPWPTLPCSWTAKGWGWGL